MVFVFGQFLLIILSIVILYPVCKLITKQVRQIENSGIMYINDLSSLTKLVK